MCIDSQALERVVVQLLKAKKKTLSVAESCTGGLIANLITNVPGSSKCFQMGIIAYSNPSKINQLKVPSKLIEKFGAVSPKVALAMAKGIRVLSKTDIAIGITGIAGPKGATKKKPVGLVYIAFVACDKEVVKKFHFSGRRYEIKKRSSYAALEMLRKYLKKI